MVPESDRDPAGPYGYNQAFAVMIAGAYENDAMALTITDDGASIWLDARLKPELRAASLAELPADYEPFEICPLPWRTFRVTSGPLNGQSGGIDVDIGGVTGVILAGRYFRRLPSAGSRLNDFAPSYSGTS
jgi:hypothetical protein